MEPWVSETSAPPYFGSRIGRAERDAVQEVKIEVFGRSIAFGGLLQRTLCEKANVWKMEFGFPVEYGGEEASKKDGWGHEVRTLLVRVVKE